MISVMYHYVREGRQKPDYYYLDVNDFRRQLDYLAEEHGFVSRSTFRDLIHGNRSKIPEGAVLTFDDGFRDHYEFVFPELKKRGLWGVFYVPAAPYHKDQLLDVHRIHLLLGETGGRELLDTTVEIVTEEQLPYRDVDAFRKAYREFDDDRATKEAKKILNMYVADHQQRDLLDALFEELNGPEMDPMTYYMTPEQIREMAGEGMTFGAHTVNHPVLSKLDQERQKEEIQTSFQVLEDMLGPLPERTFCYPYGKEHAYNQVTLEVLRETGCDWSFIVKPEDIQHSDLQNQPLQLPRYDCNRFPHGEASGTM